MKKNSLTYQTFIHAVGSFSNIILSFVLAAIMSRLLDKATYGSFRQILFLYTSLSVIFAAGLPKAISYYIPKLEIKEAYSSVVKITCVLTFCGAFLSLLFYFGAPMFSATLNNPDLTKYLKLYSPVGILLLPTLALEGVCMSYKRPTMYVYYQFLSKLMTLLAITIPLYLHYSLVTSIYLWNIVNLIFFLAFICLLKSVYIDEKFTNSGPGLKEIMRYSLPLLLASFAGILLTSADKFIVSRLFGPVQFGIYSNGAFELPLISIIAGSSTAVLLPEFARLHTGGDSAKAVLNLWHRSLIKCAMFLFPVAVFFFFYGDIALRLMYSNSYSDSTIYFRIFLLLALVKVAAYNPIMLGIGATRWYAIGHVLGAAISWGGGYWISKHFNNPAGAAGAFVVSNYVMVMLYSYILSSRLGIRVVELFPLRKLSLLLLVSLVSSLATLPINLLFTNNTHMLLHLTAVSCAFAVIFVISSFYLLREYNELLSGSFKFLTKRLTPRDA